MRFLLALVGLAVLQIRAEVKLLSVEQDPVSRLLIVQYRLTEEDAIVTLTAATNGVAVAEDAIVHVGGDVNRRVTADGNIKVACWRAQQDLPGYDGDALAVTVNAWSLAHPPRYAVVDLREGRPADARVTYYASENALPDGGLTNDVYRSEKLALVLVPAAGNTFVQGSSTTEADRIAGAHREAQRLVSFTRDFYMGVFPVTQAQHQHICESVPASQKTANAYAPVAQVTYNALRGSKDSSIDWPTTGHAVGTDSILDKWRTKTGIAFDLPTSAQWEYACRAGCGDTWYWGGSHKSAGNDYSQIEDHTWCGNNCKAPQRVGEKGANAFGLYDMIGNVWEGCLDWGDAIVLPSAGTALVDPTGSASGTARLWRGGPYSGGAAALRAAKLNPRAPGATSDGDGYRLVCPPSFAW